MLKNSLSIILCLLLVTAACTSVHAPRRSVPGRSKIVTDARGGWISIRDKYYRITEGELISVSDLVVYLVTPSGVIAVSKDDILSARLIIYNTNSSEYALWTTLGSISTISNGMFLVFTFPLWWVAGIPVMAGESDRANYIDYPAADWEHFTRFSRFPQGLPEGLDISLLRPAR